jgi:hypothetical protein
MSFVAPLRLAPTVETLFPPWAPFSVEPGKPPGFPEDPFPALIGQGIGL